MNSYFNSHFLMLVLEATGPRGKGYDLPFERAQSYGYMMYDQLLWETDWSCDVGFKLAVSSSDDVTTVERLVM